MPQRVQDGPLAVVARVDIHIDVAGLVIIKAVGRVLRAAQQCRHVLLVNGALALRVLRGGIKMYLAVHRLGDGLGQLHAGTLDIRKGLPVNALLIYHLAALHRGGFFAALPAHSYAQVIGQLPLCVRQVSVEPISAHAGTVLSGPVCLLCAQHIAVAVALRIGPRNAALHRRRKIGVCQSFIYLGGIPVGKLYILRRHRFTRGQPKLPILVHALHGHLLSVIGGLAVP